MTRKISTVNGRDLDGDDDDDDDYDLLERWTQFVISDDWDFIVDRSRVFAILRTKTAMMSKRNLGLYFTLPAKQWANLLYYREQIDNKVKALDCKSRPVDFRVHINDEYFVTVKDGWNYVHMFYYHIRVQHVKPICEHVGNCDGISLRFDEWTRLLELIPSIHDIRK